jgi:hypothetical protein
MLRIDQIVNYTKRYHPIILSNAKKIKVQLGELTGYQDKDGEVYRTIQCICTGGSKPHMVRTTYYGPYDGRAMIWASCDCEYFLYHCEVALQKKGSSDIQYSNGASPNQTNPGLIPCMCKHIAAVLLTGVFAVKPKSIKKR